MWNEWYAILQDYGPPEEVIELGEYTHPCENDVCKNITEKIPYFNAPVYLENNQQNVKIDEIFGFIKDYCFSVKLSDSMKSYPLKKLEVLYWPPEIVASFTIFKPFVSW